MSAPEPSYAVGLGASESPGSPEPLPAPTPEETARLRAIVEAARDLLGCVAVSGGKERGEWVWFKDQPTPEAMRTLAGLLGLPHG